MRRRLLAWLGLLCATCGSGGMTLATAQSRTTEVDLRGYTACFAKALGVTPRWNIAVEVQRDSTETLKNTYGTTITSSMQLEARVIYNVYAIERDAYPTRYAALHEVLHVVTGELAGLAFAHDREMAAVEAERLVRQMVRWPNWRGVCEKP